MTGLIDCPHSIYFFRGDVEYFDMDKATNTLRDWYIVPLGRPVINPPTQKRQTINIPGANGQLDVSNSLTHYPVFNNRQGQLQFAVLNDIPQNDWLTVYTKIMKFLQGNEVKFFLEDDLRYYYEGMVWVDNWNSRNDGTWSEITLGYDVQPYRRAMNNSIGNWLWDPFNFETDVVTSSIFTAIPVNSDNDWEEHDFTGFIDMMPVIPEFTVVAEENQPIQMQLYNSDLKLDWKEFSLPGGTYTLYDCIMCETTPESIIKMRFKGHGNVTIDFRSGRL